jgi:hypothetical protein
MGESEPLPQRRNLHNTAMVQKTDINRYELQPALTDCVPYQRNGIFICQIGSGNAG